MVKRKPKRAARPRIGQWVKIVQERGRSFLVIFGDELGQVSAFDQHGRVLHTSLGFAGERQRRLEAILRSPRRFASWGDL